MAFRLLSSCADGTSVLAGDDAKPVAEPRPVSVAGKRAGRIIETIGRVEKPLYVAKLDARLSEGTVLE